MRPLPDPSCWHPPLPLVLLASNDGDSFAELPQGTTALPLAPHPGAFGVVRKHHTHEGVDLYAPEGTPVYAVESGTVVRREAFTGPGAQSPWWKDTEALLVEGSTGVVVYGEIQPTKRMTEGQQVLAGELLGWVVPVLKENKGRPMTMLHLELHAPGALEAPAWEGARPVTLRDPTPFLLPLVGRTL